MPDISETLRKRFQVHSDHPDHVEPVIVTLHPQADAAQLERAGMRVAHKMRNRPVVTGTIDAGTLSVLAEMDEVVRVESDGTMDAMDGMDGMDG